MFTAGLSWNNSKVTDKASFSQALTAVAAAEGRRYKRRDSA